MAARHPILAVWTFLIGSTAALAATAADVRPNPSPEPLYVGYYQEDPVDNPEDPTIGAVYLKLPAAGGDFVGNMFFTYVGCQTSNVGAISGAMSGEQLRGSWTGTTDGSPQHGDFSGRRAASRDSYTGAYVVAGGKQHIVVPGCIDYYVASKGTFELFAAGLSEPASFTVAVRDKVASWSAASDVIMTLVAVLDPELARSGKSNATLWQTLAMGAQHTIDLSGHKLMSGHTYLATVGTVDQSLKRISFGSVQFVMP